uniref:Uncharacterized protein n=1 Tax=Setaria italica TaxID=4555 RepID=K3YUX8_SETIT
MKASEQCRIQTRRLPLLWPLNAAVYSFCLSLAPAGGPGARANGLKSLPRPQAASNATTPGNKLRAAPPRSHGHSALAARGLPERARTGPRSGHARPLCAPSTRSNCKRHTRHGARRVVHAEQHLHHARERAAAAAATAGGGRSRLRRRQRLRNWDRKRRPRGEEDDLHHLPRRVPRGELGQRRDRAERTRGRRRRHHHGGRLRLGLLARLGTRLRRPRLRPRPAGGLRRGDVAEGVPGAPAPSAREERVVELLGRHRDPGGHVVGRHGLAVE